jgi:hypothetical protein
MQPSQAKKQRLLLRLVSVAFSSPVPTSTVQRSEVVSVIPVPRVAIILTSFPGVSFGVNDLIFPVSLADPVQLNFFSDGVVVQVIVSSLRVTVCPEDYTLTDTTKFLLVDSCDVGKCLTCIFCFMQILADNATFNY